MTKTMTSIVALVVFAAGIGVGVAGVRLNAVVLGPEEFNAVAKYFYLNGAKDGVAQCGRGGDRGDGA